MKTALLFLCILGIACAFSVKNFRRRFKSEDSEENAVLKNRYRYFLHRYPYLYSPMKRFQSNSDSSEEGYGGDSSEEEEEEEEEEAGGQSNEENNGENGEATEAPTAPGTKDKKGVSNAKPPKQVPVRKEPLAKPGKEGGAQKGEKDNAPEKGGKKEEEEEDSDENEEEEAEEEEEQVDENGSGVNGTSTNSTAEENGNGGNGEEEEEEGEENGGTTAAPTTVVTTVIPSTEYQYETTTEGRYMTSPEDVNTVEYPWSEDPTTTAIDENVHGQTDYYGSENGYPRGDTFRTYEDEYSYYKGHGYDVYGQDYYYNQ
ncbi:bone sialoprotein 2 [Elgaria multicarinata webbii]|uniref:bone sialoprotein 2 n=1 Tax=Elgaria multicarinata webbii TaxID=159646 RepID=UPI002FCCD69D